VGVEPGLAAFAEPTRFLRVLSSATASGVVCRRSSTTSRGIRTSAVTLRPRPSTALMAAGFLSEQRLPEGDRQAAVSASTTPQTASVAMVAMFIPIASLVS